MNAIAARVADVRARIAGAALGAGRDPTSITLVAVTKTQLPEMVEAAIDAGVSDLGENYAQELVAKQEALTARPLVAARWHFIGRLQRNKIRLVVGRVALIHAVDSVALAEEIDRRAAIGTTAAPAQALLVAVNLGAEVQKVGVIPADLPKLLAAIAALPRCRCDGLMTLPPVADDPEITRPYFRALRILRDQLATPACPLPILSMGMSSDFEVAIAEGATLVRVGTAIFGPRG
jgi:pyridoxal phosphate enzyme (YggS family)